MISVLSNFLYSSFYPEHVVDDQGQMREHAKFYVYNAPIEFDEAKDFSLADSKQIHIMQAISGG